MEMLCHLHDITSAEKRVLDWLLDGRPVEGMAAQFGVKVSTVPSQVAALRAKLGLRGCAPDQRRLAPGGRIATDGRRPALSGTPRRADAGTGLSQPLRSYPASG